MIDETIKNLPYMTLEEAEQLGMVIQRIRPFDEKMQCVFWCQVCTKKIFLKVEDKFYLECVFCRKKICKSCDDKRDEGVYCEDCFINRYAADVKG